MRAGHAAVGVFQSSAINSEGDTRVSLLGDDRPSSISSPTTVTGSYLTQYLVTFKQTGLAGDATGVLCHVCGAPKLTLLCSEWFDEGSTLQYQYEDPVSSSMVNLRYILLDVAGPSSGSAVNGSGEVTGNFERVPVTVVPEVPYSTFSALVSMFGVFLVYLGTLNKGRF